MSSLKNEVVKAQGQIIDALVHCETQISKMYDGFAVVFPDAAKLWSEVAAEERRHAGALYALHTILERGCLFHDIGRFDQAKIKEVHDFLDGVHKIVATGKMTPAEAFAGALKVECALVESRFYKDVSSDAPEFAAVCRMLQRESEEHIVRISSVFRRDIRWRQVDPWSTLKSN